MKTLRFLSKTAIALLFICFFIETTQAQNRKKVDSLLRILKTLTIDTSKVNLLLDVGKIYRNNKPDIALYYYKMALLAASKANSKKHIAKGLICIGLIYNNQGAYDKALEYYLKSLKISEEIVDKKGISYCYLNIGTIYSAMGTYNKALEYYFKALKYFEKFRDKNGIAICYEKIGMVNYDQGVSISNRVHKADKFKKALEYYFKSLKLFEELGDKDGISICYIDIGNVYYYQGAFASDKEHKADGYNKALEYWLKSVSIFEEIGNKFGMSSCYNNIGSIFFNQGTYNEAIEYYLKSLKINEEIGNKKGISLAYTNIAFTNFRLKKYNEAIKYAYKGLNLAKEINAVSIQKDNYENIAYYYDSLHDYKNAYNYYKLFKQINDSIFNEESNKQINNLQIKYETEKKEQEILLKDKELEIKDLKISRMNYYFLILFIIVLIALFIGLYIIRKNKFQMMIQNMQLEQKLLRSQMNPHFIFNLLSAIQNLILLNKNETAVDYLSRLAKLIRMILENSRHEYITLDKETNMLELYMDMQAIRFKNKFNYVIETDSELSPEIVNIPPMLAQPFIENSIEHGIMHKEEKGNIKITFKEVGDLLIFEVTDDGVGREKAKEIESQNNADKKHVSLATSITQERLENINKSLKRKEKIKLNITDLKDESGKALGTKVSFSIPFKIN